MIRTLLFGLGIALFYVVVVYAGCVLILGAAGSG